MGRTRKSVEEHKKQGTYRADRHDLPEVGQKVVNPKPYMPLKGFALEFFEGVCKDLADQKKLAPEDLMLITHLAMLAGQIAETYQIVEKQGYASAGSTGALVVNPYQSVFMSAMKEFNTLTQKMGIGPLARLRLALNSKQLEDPKEKKQVDL